MRISFLGILIAAAIAAVPSVALSENVSNQVAPAAANSSAPADTAAKPDANAEKKICKRLESSYSHASDRVCLTRSEWQQVEVQD